VRKAAVSSSEESDRIGYVPRKRALNFSRYMLKAKGVNSYRSGPRMAKGDEDMKLRRALQQTLLLAREHKFRSVSMPLSVLAFRIFQRTVAKISGQ